MSQIKPLCLLDEAVIIFRQKYKIVVLNLCLGARPELLPTVLLKDSCLLG